MPLSGVWTEVDPLGDCTVTTSGGNVSIAIPAGVSHDLWSTNKNACRILQAASNDDFTVDTKLTSALTLNNQNAGIIVQQDTNNFIRFDFYKSTAGVSVFAATFSAGTPTTRVNSVVAGVTFPLYMRVERVANQWTFRSSQDGVNYTQRATFSFTLTVSNVGLFAGIDGTFPAFTALFDYFVEDAPLGGLVFNANIADQDIDSLTAAAPIQVGVVLESNIGNTSNAETDTVDASIIVGINITLDIQDDWIDVAVGQIVLGDPPEPPPVIPTADPILNLFVADQSRVRIGLDSDTQAAKALYSSIKKYVESLQPWEKALVYQVKPNETHDLHKVSLNVYGRPDEVLAIMASAGLNSVIEPLLQQQLVLPPDDVLNRIKRQVGHESIAALREDLKPVWRDDE